MLDTIFGTTSINTIEYFFRIEKHEEICFKTAAKKRKTYDMTKVKYFLNIIVKIFELFQHYYNSSIKIEKHVFKNPYGSFF